MQAQFVLSDLKTLVDRVPAIIHTINILIQKPRVQKLPPNETVIIETSRGRVLLKDKNGNLISSALKTIS